MDSKREREDGQVSHFARGKKSQESSPEVERLAPREPPGTPPSSPSGRQDIGVQTLRVGMCGGGTLRKHQEMQPEQPTP